MEFMDGHGTAWFPSELLDSAAITAKGRVRYGTVLKHYKADSRLSPFSHAIV